MFSVWALLGAVLAVVGCQTLPAQSGGADPAQAELIRYGSSLRAFDEATLEDQYEMAYSSHASDPSADSAIRLALLLSYPGATFYDPGAARELLGSVAAQRSAPRAAELARLLDSMLSERSCVTGERGALVELYFEERDRSLGLSAELAEARAALASERQLRQTLQGQLDALKALEERLNADGLGN